MLHKHLEDISSKMFAHTFCNGKEKLQPLLRSKFYSERLHLQQRHILVQLRLLRHMFREYEMSCRPVHEKGASTSGNRSRKKRKRKKKCAAGRTITISLLPDTWFTKLLTHVVANVKNEGVNAMMKMLHYLHMKKTTYAMFVERMQMWQDQCKSVQMSRMME